MEMGIQLPWLYPNFCLLLEETSNEGGAQLPQTVSPRPTLQMPAMKNVLHLHEPGFPPPVWP